MVVLEREGPAQALARSWRLVRQSFWRVFGIPLLAGIIVPVAGGILRLPFTFFGAVLGRGIGGTVILVIGAIAAGTMTQPITAGVTVLLYVDMRMRKEGLDLALRTASGAGQARGPAAGGRGLWRPARRRLRHRVAAAVGRPGAGPGRTSHGRGGPAAVVSAAGPLTGREAGQRLARAELSKAIYHPHESLTQRVLNAIGDLLNDLSQAGRAFPGGWWAAVALAALLATIIAVVLSRIGPLARSRRAEGQLMAGSGPLSAADHRLRAGAWPTRATTPAAIMERVRAIARELDDRAVLTPRAGRTANEMAEEAGAALPARGGCAARRGPPVRRHLLRRAPRHAGRVRAGPASWTRGSARRCRSPAPPWPGRAGRAGRAGRDRAGSGRGRSGMTGPAPILAEPGPGPAAPGRGPATPRSRGPGLRRARRAGRPAAARAAPLAGAARRAGAGPAGRDRDRAADAVPADHRLPRSGQSRTAGHPGAGRPPGPGRAAGVRADSVAAARDAVQDAGHRTGPGRAPALVITSPYLLSPGQLAELARLPGNIMVVEPDSATLSALNRATAGTAAPQVTVAGADAVRPVRPGCTLAAATVAGDAGLGGVLMRVSGTAGRRCATGWTAIPPWSATWPGDAPSPCWAAACR